MIDPKVFDLPVEENELGPKGETSASSSWRELSVYMRKIHSAFHTTRDYRAALRFFSLRYPNLKDVLDDWSKN
jgi:hypothetical protein